MLKSCLSSRWNSHSSRVVSELYKSYLAWLKWSHTPSLSVSVLRLWEPLLEKAKLDIWDLLILLGGPRVSGMCPEEIAPTWPDIYFVSELKWECKPQSLMQGQQNTVLEVGKEVVSLSPFYRSSTDSMSILGLQTSYIRDIMSFLRDVLMALEQCFSTLLHSRHSSIHSRHTLENATC